MERETEVIENQISFDFETEKLQTETLTKGEVFEWKAEDTLVLILSTKYAHPNFYICGKKMIDWVGLACSGCRQEFLFDVDDEDILAIAKPYAEKADNIVVLYSDTPLLQKTTFLEIMNRFASQNMNFMKLPRGYVFKSEFLRTSKMIMSANESEFGHNDFEIIDSANKISFAFKVLNDRILSYHKQNGVVIFGEDTVFVDADVEIEAGTVIYPNNILKGQSYIGKNVILESGNYIIDSIVHEGAFVCQSYIENSSIDREKVVGPFLRIIKEKI